MSYTTGGSRFEQAFINEECFDILKKTDQDPAEFWKKRAILLAGELFRLQYV